MVLVFFMGFIDKDKWPAVSFMKLLGQSFNISRVGSLTDDVWTSDLKNNEKKNAKASGSSLVSLLESSHDDPVVTHFNIIQLLISICCNY